MKLSTKECPKCGNTKLILMATLEKKGCGDCGENIPWFLDDGQKGLLHKAFGGPNVE